MTRLHQIWHPLNDTPVTVQMSREQLQLALDALMGRHNAPRGWEESLAQQFEIVLKESINDEAES